MSMTYTQTVGRETAAYGGFADALGGVATIVLAIVGLAGMRPEIMIGIATVVFGAALLIEGGAMLSEYAQLIFPMGARAPQTWEFGGNGLSALFTIGAAGIVLGVLALLGIASAVLTSVAIIAFGSALVLSSNAVWSLSRLRQAAAPSEAQTVSGGVILANEIASGSSGVLSLAGLAAIILGVLAVAGMNSIVLTLAALLVLGAALIMTGSTLSATVFALMRPSESPASTRSA
jgi:hypothetical protein